MKKLLFVSTFFLLMNRLSAGDIFCGSKNLSFNTGEKITYHVFYSVIGLYVHAGNAVFSTELASLNNKPVYHIIGDGSSNSRYDWIFKVRDRYESFLDTSNLLPQKFLRTINEGGFKMSENVLFNQQNNTASSAKGTFKTSACIQDVLSAIYYARNIDFSNLKPEDKIPFTMFLDNQVYNLYIKYLGRETIKTKYGTFHSIKFKPLLVKGTMFDGGEKMTVWVTDDSNHIPVRVESPIVVGSIKADLMEFSGLRHPMTALVSKS